MHKIFLSLLALFAVATGFNRVQKTPSQSSLVEPVTQITYSDGNFSGTNNFTITKSGAGFVANSTYPQAFNISDKASYLEIKPNSSTAISSDSGFSIALNLSSKDGEDTDSYEQLLTVEGDGGLSAHINVATLYYLASSSASTTYAVPNGGNKLTLDSSKKYQIFVVDYEAESIFVYVNGTLTNKFTPDNSKADVIADVIEAFKLLKTNGTSLFLRKPCAKKTTRNTSSIIAANISLYNSVISAEQAAKMFEDGSTAERNDLPISVDSCDDYRISSVGYGINSYATDKPNSFNIGDQTSYLSFKAASDKKLTQNGKGFSLSFYQKATTDTFYSGNASLRPNVTDDFEQLLTVEDGTGRSAHICTGGMYYSETGSDSTYATPRPNDTDTLHVLLTTEWKYVTINVNAEDQSVIIYVDGVVKHLYEQTHPTRAAMIRNVVSMFNDAASSLGGEIFLRKPFPLKVNRNSATNIFDEVVFDECKTPNEILALHDSKMGKIRVTFVPNIDVPFADLVGQESIAVPAYEGGVEGYTFEGYYFDAEHTQKVPDNYVATSSITLYPYFKLVTYTITYHLDGGVNNENNPTEYNAEQKITLLDASKEGYAFAGWYRTAKFENKVTILVEGTHGNIDLYAKFERNVYKITYILNGGILTEEATETFTLDDDEIVLPNAWKPELTFVGWYSDENFTQKVTTIDPKCGHDVTVYANFAISYKVTYVLNGGQLGEGAVETFTIYDGIINLPSAHKDGFTFEGWYSDVGFTNKVEHIDSAVGQDVTLYAKFVENSVEPEPEEPKSKNNNTGLIIGLSIGGGVLLIGVAVLVVMMLRRKKA